MLDQFGLSDCTPVSTLIETLAIAEDDLEFICDLKTRTEYQHMIGSLMYIMLGTRGDIAYAVSVAS